MEILTQDLTEEVAQEEIAKERMDLDHLELAAQKETVREMLILGLLEELMETLTQDLQEVAPPRELLMVIHFLNRSEGLDKDAIQQDLELKH
tara:strand:- start:4504 stop:4779 length:276 start_codon:yes stop_codon:yes gene_type:complete